jgi:hypothetical protein
VLSALCCSSVQRLWQHLLTERSREVRWHRACVYCVDIVSVAKILHSCTILAAAADPRQGRQHNW